MNPRTRWEHNPRFCVAGMVTGLWLALLILGGTAGLAYLAAS